MLLAQLEWPSGVVKERACVSIAELLGNPGTAGSVRAELLRWLGAQTLESFSAYGLLPLTYAKTQSATFDLSVREIRASIKRPSLLSWLLLRDLGSDYDEPLENSLCHSSDVPAGFEVRTFFDKYVKSFLPPIYAIWSTRIEDKYSIPFHQQWAFEWESILEKTNTQPSTEGVDFWVGWREGQERYAAVDLHLSEVYRSAFLRAIAWAVDRGGMPTRDGCFLAARTCPLDLELWALRPHPRPSWWPRTQESASPVDTVAGQVWTQLDALWEQQWSVGMTEEILSGPDTILAEADGRVHAGTAVYDLSIYGVFQKCNGPIAPEPEQIGSWLCEDDRGVAPGFRSLLRFQGAVPSADPNDCIRPFADWTLLPSGGYANSIPTPRWQYWRMRRGIWLPSPALVKEQLTFGREDDWIVSRDEQNRVLGYWGDWTDGVSEKVIDELPPATGHSLLIPRSVVDQFAAATGSTFCWVCRLTGYTRQHTYEAFKSYSTWRILGATRVVRG